MTSRVLFFVCAVVLAASTLTGGEAVKKPVGKRPGLLRANAGAAENSTPADRLRAVESAYRRYLSLPVPKIPADSGKPGYLGVALDTIKAGDTNKIPHVFRKGETGLRILKVYPGTPSAEGGLEEGDFIIAIDGTPIPGKGNAVANFTLIMGERRPGQKVQFRVARNGKLMSFTVTLGSIPRAGYEIPKHPELEAGTDSLFYRVLKEKELIRNVDGILAGIHEGAFAVFNAVPLVKGRYNPYRLSEVTYALTHPGALAPRAQKIAHDFESCWDAGFPRLSALVGEAARKIDLDIGQYSKAKKWEAPLEDLSAAVKRFAEARDSIISGISQEDRDYLNGALGSWLGNLLATDGKNDESVRALKLGLAVDREALFRVAGQLVNQLTAENIEALRFEAETRLKESGKLSLSIETGMGAVIIGGAGNDVYTEDCAVIIELGGDDVYRNRVGCADAKQPFGLLLDFSGDDIYSGAQAGAGVIGLGVCLDLGGDDVYMSGSGSQGYGALGVGILYDAHGDDRYAGKTAVQGAALMGIGILLDGAGRDSYDLHLGGQAFGMPGGIGILLDKSGNDVYSAGGKYLNAQSREKHTDSFAQGFGFGLRPWDIPTGASGGMGVLVDFKGNDVYNIDLWGQGASYWSGYGLLVDNGGGDSYFSNGHSQGHGNHYAAGALIDHAGNDRYLANWGVAVACAHDHSSAALVDMEGNDSYSARLYGVAWGNSGGAAFLLDVSGTDQYVSRSMNIAVGRGSDSRQGVIPSLAVIIDDSGLDHYAANRREITNNALSRNGDYGFIIDTVLGRVPGASAAKNIKKK